MLRDDSAAIHTGGHRKFVGGEGKYWRAISKVQFDFLVSNGLRPSDIVLDLACGSLRAGVRLIPYLDRGHYIGIDKHIELVIYGVAKELGLRTFRNKQPQFIINDKFDFSGLHAAPTFAIAQSLFTHLTRSDISVCLRNLKYGVAPGCRFFVSFNEAEKGGQNPATSHSHDTFWYMRQEMEELGQGAGWSPIYVGAWGHPRGAHLIEFRAAA
jgi:SAM-dependent methyltransferase